VLSRATVACFPSRFEGWGLAVAEAVALGVPVVASDLPGIRSILRDGAHGTLVEPASKAQVVEALGTPPQRRGPVSVPDVSDCAESYVRLLEPLSRRPPVAG
jgi:glycosyltransferase involved in cell wall biosynthesis